MHELLFAITLVSAFGHMGTRFWAVYVCLIVTTEHFKTVLARSLRGLVPPAAVVLTAVAVDHGATRVIGSENWHGAFYLDKTRSRCDPHPTANEAAHWF